MVGASDENRVASMLGTAGGKVSTTIVSRTMAATKIATIVTAAGRASFDHERRRRAVLVSCAGCCAGARSSSACSRCVLASVGMAGS
jgi:hypothetical protein